MASPKNYTKLKSTAMGVVAQWNHDEKNVAVFVDDKSPMTGQGSQYDVVVREGMSKKTVGSFASKQDAKSKAVSWMRNHPNG